MAKFTNESYFTIDPLSLVKDRELTFDVFIYLPLNERIILYRRTGEAIEDMQELLVLRDRGLLYFHLRESDRANYIAYTQGAGESAATTPDQLERDKAATTESGHEAFKATNQEATAADPSSRDAALTTSPRSTTQPEPGANPQSTSPTLPDPSSGPSTTNAISAAASAVEQLDASAAPAPEESTPYIPERPADQLMAGMLGPEPGRSIARANAKDMVKNILKASNASPEVNEILENPNTEHATNVAIYTALFAMGLKKNDQHLLQDLIIASLLHDLGVTQVTPDILAVPRTKQTEAQREAFELHVQLGLALLADLDYVPNKRVIQMIFQHHEKFNGTGYPAHLESFRIDETATLISIADLIDTVGRGQYDGVRRSMDDTLALIAQLEKTSTFPEHFNPDVFKKVMNWLKAGGGRDYMAIAKAVVDETKQKVLKSA